MQSPRLVISAGGKWFAIEEALKREFSIRDHIRVIGYGGWNIGDSSEPDQRAINAYNYVKGKLGSHAITYEVPFFTSSAANIFDNKQEADSWYDTNLKPFLQKVTDPNGVNLVDEAGYYVQETRSLAHGQYTVNVQGTKLRVADFVSVYHLIVDGDAIVDEALNTQNALNFAASVLTTIH